MRPQRRGDTAEISGRAAVDAVTELNSFAATRSERLGGDWTKVVGQIVVERLVLCKSPDHTLDIDVSA